MGSTSARWAGAAMLAAIGVLGAACGSASGAGGQGPATTTTVGTAGDDIELSQSCTRTEGGATVTVRFPRGWRTYTGEVIPACSAFDPDPVTIPQDSEVPLDLAVTVDVERAPFAQVRDWAAATVESSRNVTVSGRPGVRQELVSTGEGITDKGVRWVRYVVDLGGSTLVATTYRVPGNDFERSVRALDAMAAAIEVGPTGT